MYRTFLLCILIFAVSCTHDKKEEQRDNAIPAIVAVEKKPEADLSKIKIKAESIRILYLKEIQYRFLYFDRYESSFRNKAFLCLEF
jgi:hypothetical protein